MEIDNRPVQVFGMQQDGTVKSILEEENFDDLNPQSIQILVDMGYEFSLVIKALRQLKL